LQNHQESEIAQIIGIGREAEGRRKDGSVFPMNLAVGEIKDGKDYAFVGVVRDLTDEKRGIAALIEARLKAEFANQAKSEFLSRMSHELRTPMNAVLGFAQLSRMLEPDLSAEQRADYLESIIGPAQHLTTLIDDILDLSSIEAGRVRVARDAVNLADAIAGALTMTQPLARRSGISVFSRGLAGEAAPMVQGDALRLRQCIVNLVSNAVKYSHPQGRVLIGWSESDAHAGLVRLTVEDSGHGIPEARMGDLFRPFTRLHQTLEHIEGAGIGLAMTRQLVEAMGGRISAESEIGRGSKFHLDLPVVVRKRSGRPRARSEKPVGPAAATEGNHRKVVLYVEDNPANVHLMESVFRAMPGAELRVATDAETGLELAATGAVRAIILDINLPGMDGFAALARLRAEPQTADLPVIGLSARASGDDIERASDLGFYRYLTKPVDVRELLETLKTVL
jgi:signal transduction histidine kinase/CheY-like chemotaxis protein